MLNVNVSAPCAGAGNAGPIKAQDQRELTPIWASHEISNHPLAISYAAVRALDYAEMVHDADCEDRGRLFPNAIRERCADPALLLRFLPFDIIAPVRREAERMLLAWPS